jgi:predicted metal-dependent peptidase
MDISLAQANTYLLSAKQKNFFARIIACLTYVEVEGFGTCAVGIGKTGRLCFFYDPAFLKKISLPELVLVYEHEVYHLILDHIPRYLDLISGLVSKEDKRRYKAAMNTAADLADNELMRQEPGFKEKSLKYFLGAEGTSGHGFLMPETFGLKNLQTFEVYLYNILGKMKKISQQLAPEVSVDVYAVPAPGAGQGKGDQKGQGSGDDQKDGQEQQPGQGGAQGQGEPQKGQDGGQGQGEPQEGQGDQKDQDGKGGGQGDQEKEDDGAPEPGTPLHILETYLNGKIGDAHKYWEKEGMTDEERQGMANRLGTEARHIVSSALNEHKKSRGTLPGGMEELLEEFLQEPKIPWPTVLRALVARTRQTKIDRGMSRPNRRRHGVPDILPFPGKARDSRFTLAFALDTSGSMGKEELEAAIGELLNIVRTEPDVVLHVMYCDADLHITYRVEEMSDVDFNVLGRGGTDFNPPFIKVRELLRGDEAPDILVYATDGYAPAPHPDNRVPIPVIWLITPGGTIPSPDYGIHIEMDSLE